MTHSAGRSMTHVQASLTQKVHIIGMYSRHGHDSSKESAPFIRQVHLPGVEKNWFWSMAVDLLLAWALQETRNDFPKKSSVCVALLEVECSRA